MADLDSKSQQYSALAKETDSKNELSVPDTVAPGEEEGKNLDVQSVGSNLGLVSSASEIQREKWGSKMQFLMSCIASAVGLGNVWRFPAICAKNGGATFLIPYTIVLFVIARPLFVLELALGQFSSKGSVRCWDLSPAFTGIGYAGMTSSVLLSTFYLMLMAWALIYMVVAFVSICYDPTGVPVWTNATGQFFGGKVLEAVSFDAAENQDIQTYKPVCHLVLALLIAWFVIWVSMVFGVEASGKFAYVTALAPYVVLIILLIAGLLLPGMEVGLEYLFYPDPKKLLEANTWFQAVGQCFFSLGIGFGGCIMFSSYNDFHNDIVHDVLIISIVDSITSILAGISLLSILGFAATHKYEELMKDTSSPGFISLMKCAAEVAPDKTLTQEQIEKFIKEEKVLKKCALVGIVGEQGGAGLAFVHYPNAMNKINESWGAPIGTIFGFLFFIMLILLAVGSANGFVGTTVTIISDKFPKWKRSNIVSGVCFFSFSLGLIYTNRIGSEWFDVVDIHGVTAVVYVLAFLEVAAVTAVYGLKRFCDDLQFMRNGKAIGLYFKITWVCLPFLMLGIYIYWLANYEKLKTWTTTVVVIAWIITVCCMSIIPAFIVLKMLEFRKNPWRRHVPNTWCAIAGAVFQPNPKWGPKDPESRREWKKFKEGRPETYNICGKIRNMWYQCVLRKPAPDRPATEALSYATLATNAPEAEGLDPNEVQQSAETNDNEVAKNKPISSIPV